MHNSRTALLLLLTLLAGMAVRPAAANEDAALQTAIRNVVARGEVVLPAHSDPHWSHGALEAVYARREYNTLWTRDGKPTPQALALLQELRAADTYGLRPADYAVESIAALLNDPETDKSAELERLARFDVALSSAAGRFLTHLHFGRVDPRADSFELGPARPELDIGALLTTLATTANTSQVTTSVEPPFYHYRLLKDVLPHYRQLAAEPGLTDLPPVPGRAIKAGESYAGAPALRRLLRALGDLPAEAHGAHDHDGAVANQSPPGNATASTDPVPPDERTLDPALVVGLKRFQERHGLEPDGAIGRTTYAALTTPLARRVRQIELTLERWRWLPAFETPPIIVNIPQFRLFAFRSTQDLKADILQMDVIVGRTYPRMRTPVFVADMRYVIFRPYWDVPYSITVHEMLPQLRSNPGYLEAQHLEIVRGEEDVAEPMPPTPENLDELAAGKLRLRQKPGPDNALGLIKFMLPNSYNVYLHSTPAHRLFSESRRAFSHGCIRVSDPVALAAHVLRDAPGEWTPERIEAAMNGSSTLRVNLTRPIRVMILYATALATEAGTVLFFDDIYGHDRKLETLLGLERTGT